MSTEPTIGKRVVVHAFAESPAEALAGGLAIEDQALPVPGPRDVVVAVRAASVGWVDLLMTSGQYQHAPPLPYTPGLEYASVVEAVGPGVVGVQVGDRVMADGFRTGPRSPGDYQRHGGFATWALAPEEGVMPIPAGFSFEEAAHFLGNYETAWYVLVTCGQLRAGETALIHGATGSTGIAAVQIAKQLGATVIATGRSAEKLAALREDGADHLIVPRREGAELRFREEVKELTGGRGVDVVYDGVGGPISVESLRAAAFGARILLVGWASTPDVARGKGLRGAPNANQLPTNLILMKGLRVIGCPTVIATQRDPGLRAPRIAALLEWAAAGRIRPRVGGRWPLEDFREAMAAKWESRVVGGVTLVA